MKYRALGKTGFEISRLGIGLAEIGETETEVAQVDRLLNTALDNGINFLDTAACYGNSEELIGQTVSARRDDFILATKCGHITGGYQGTDWTCKTLTDSINRSLVRLKTDHVDLLQLHSCDLEILERGEVIEALKEARTAGKTRFIGYSGDNEEARWAVDSGLFDTLQTSFSVVDQRARSGLFATAEAKGMGVIVKRPIANGAWASERTPSAYSKQYFERAKEMAGLGPIAGMPTSAVELAFQFVMAHGPVDTAIVGTRNPEHLLGNIEMLDQGDPLPQTVIDELYGRFEQLGRNWVQLR